MGPGATEIAGWRGFGFGKVRTGQTYEPEERDPCDACWYSRGIYECEVCHVRFCETCMVRHYEGELYR